MKFDILPIVTIVALFAGPVFAVWLGDWLQRLKLFSTLMATRPMTMAPDKLRALSTVDVAFNGQQRVIDKWRDYYDAICNPAYNDVNGSLRKLLEDDEVPRLAGRNGSDAGLRRYRLRRACPSVLPKPCGENGPGATGNGV